MKSAEALLKKYSQELGLHRTMSLQELIDHHRRLRLQSQTVVDDHRHVKAEVSHKDCVPRDSLRGMALGELVDLLEVNERRMKKR